MHQRIPQLDAVRGIAVLVVMLHNSGAFPRLFAHGWMGVDLFFVLSGFLISGILLDTKQSESYFNNFYIRRCLRIWPLYYSALVFMFVLVPFLRPSEASAIFASRSSPWWAFPLFLQNFLVPSPTGATGLLGVTWSLAVEEQFYLVWPWVIRYCSCDSDASHCHRGDLRFSDASLLSLITSSEHLLKSILSVGCPDGGSPPRGSSSFGELSALQILKASLDCFLCRSATGASNGNFRCKMDRVLLHGDGLSFICVSGDVLLAKMAPSRIEEPVPDIHGRHQLWPLLASQNSV